jgi:NAD-dependent SIR2 family protein deacetylase
MNSNISKELTSEILNKKLAFFIGAGFDYNSGVPLVKGTHGIMTKILNKLPLNDKDKLQILNTILPQEKQTTFSKSLFKNS